MHLRPAQAIVLWVEAHGAQLGSPQPYTGSVSETQTPLQMCRPIGQPWAGGSATSGALFASGASEFGAGAASAAVGVGPGVSPASSAVASVPGWLSRMLLQPRNETVRTLATINELRSACIIGNSPGA